MLIYLPPPLSLSSLCYLARLSTRWATAADGKSSLTTQFEVAFKCSEFHASLRMPMSVCVCVSGCVPGCVCWSVCAWHIWKLLLEHMKNCAHNSKFCLKIFAINNLAKSAGSRVSQAFAKGLLQHHHQHQHQYHHYPRHRNYLEHTSHISLAI